jgi:Zn-finger nucleic acid-binding protein
MIDHCLECKGIWLDKGELRSMLQNKAPERAIERTPGLAKWGKQVCPRCKGTMRIKFIKDIEVDECSDCKGIWLDNGELGRLGDKDLGPLGDGRVRNILRSLRDGIRKRL